ncbi:RNA polymerase sigma factor [Paenibacillus durus]|uniref:RNA polymerase sigma-70 region 2 domain-containing protein n=1 Tax=Paenibacillus durus TaxID=44251 RepID=A0A089IXG0_PAEDU|nr:sigma-70 family RNA polymerase sigma factor [Paenibacillus durus]AIQ13644.1 hypothetical protein PDUR_18270 [Paenibacillus durus]
MSAIHSSGEALSASLKQRAYLDRRRKDVDDAWATYILEAIERSKAGKPQPVRYGFDDLNAQTDTFVKREAGRWARSCRKYRLYEDDFESHFRFTVAKAALRYDGKNGSFFDYLRGSIRNAGRDMVRRALTKKNRINHLALSLQDEAVMREVERSGIVASAEEQAIAQYTVECMAADTSLTDTERAVFELLRADPEATLQEIANALGLSDRKQAQRLKQRLAEKLRKYITDAP